MNEFAEKLYRLIGIQYEYKLLFREFLDSALDSALVVGFESGPNTPALRADFAQVFAQCGPAMSFEAKRAAYGCLELICEALAAHEDVEPADVTIINSKLVYATKFVGLAEGDGEDFHFMVAAYELAKEIARIDDETIVAVTGPIATLSLTSGGAGITTDGTTNSDTQVVFSVGGGDTTASAEGTITGGVLTELTAITAQGTGFEVGQVVTLTIDTTVVGQEDATQVTAPTATVLTLA